MKLNNINEVDEFLRIVNECSGDVRLRSIYGDEYNLKSKLTQFIAVGQLLGEHGDELELFCDNREDEPRFFRFLASLER